MTDNERKEDDKKRNERKQVGNWAEDQEARKYYYDDATGYEKYDPDSDDDEPDEKFTDSSR